jgi:hypothetical protein
MPLTSIKRFVYINIYKYVASYCYFCFFVTIVKIYTLLNILLFVLYWIIWRYWSSIVLFNYFKCFLVINCKLQIFFYITYFYIISSYCQGQHGCAFLPDNKICYISESICFPLPHYVKKLWYCWNIVENDIKHPITPFPFPHYQVTRYIL